MNKILLIEDNLEIRENLEEILELANYEVFTAENGHEGIAYIRHALPDLILCDIAMPEVDGYQMLEYVRSIPKTVRIPFVFISSSAQQTDMEKGLLAGADAYLTKPFSRETLMVVIEQFITKIPS